MRKLSLLVCVLLATTSFGQEVIKVNEKPSPAQVQTAQDILKKVQSEPVVIPYGGYALAEIEFTGKLICYVVPGSDDCLDQNPMPKGAGYKGWMVPKGATTFNYITLAPDKDKDRVRVNGIKEGTATLIWITNGATPADEPKVIAGYKFIVGNPPPKPDPVDPNPPAPTPSSDPLAMAAAADIKAGKGTAEDVEAYAGIYQMFGLQVKNGGGTLATVGELFKAMNLSIDTLLGTDMDKTLPTLRRAVAKELVAKIPVNPSLKLADNAATISAEFSSINKRLQGVK